MTIHPIEAFSDNYIWILNENGEAIIVDPGESAGVIDFLDKEGIESVAILLTHNHEDHTAGVEEIMNHFPEGVVYGPKETAYFVDHVVEDGDIFVLFDRKFEVFLTAGHTEGHVSYLNNANLFCGDALFSGGCGRVFTGDYEAQFEAMQKFKQLDRDVKVFAAHEYTKTNLRFALSIEPENETISRALDEVVVLREEGQPTLPSTIEKELAINLLLQAETLEDFIALREARDDF